MSHDQTPSSRHATATSRSSRVALRNPTAIRRQPTSKRLLLAAGGALVAVLVACGDNTVTPPVLSPSERNCGASFELGAGQSVVLDPNSSGSCEFFLPSGSAGDRYRVGVVFASTDRSVSSESAVFSVDRRGAAAAPVQEVTPRASVAGDRSTIVIPSDLMQRDLDLDRLDATERVHERLRRADAELVAEMGREALLPDLSQVVGLAPATTRASEPGDVAEFYEASTSCDLGDLRTIEAEWLHESDDVIFYQDSEQRPTEPVQVSDLELMANYYAAFGRPVIEDYFGGISDVDDNGGKAIVLITAVPQSIGEDAAAFVLSRDFLRPAQCPASNHAELIYFSAGAINAMEGGQFQVLATLVHEMKHVSSLYNGIERAQTGDFQPTWIEEGTADIAGEVSSRLAWNAEDGPPVGARVTGSDLVNTSAGIESYGLLVRLGRLVGTLAQQPNALTEDPVASGPAHSFYGSSWHFHRFLGDAFEGGPLSEAAFFRDQNSPDSPAGVAFLESALGESIEELLQAYTLATMANGAPFEDDLLRSFSSYDFTSAAEIFCVPNPVGIYPWPVTTLGTSSQGSCQGGGSDPSEESFVLAAPFEDAVYDGPDTEGDPEPPALIGHGGLRIYELVSDGSGEGVDVLVELDSEAADDGRVVVVRLE